MAQPLLSPSEVGRTTYRLGEGDPVSVMIARDTDQTDPATRWLALADEIDEALEALLPHTGITVLDEAVAYSLGLDTEDRRLRGKRLRPVLCLLVAESLGAPRPAALRFGAAMELVHNFFLVHDDIQDGDTIRRHRPAVWVRFGVDHAISVGNYLHALAVDAVATLPDHGCPLPIAARVLSLLTRTVLRTGEGQVLDVETRGADVVDDQDYLRLVTLKTGDYMAAPLVGGALLADADPAICAALLEFGRALGRVYQVADDMIDLTDAKGRGIVGADIAEGKRSWPALYVAARCNPLDRARLFDVLDRPREETTEDDIRWVMGLYARFDVRNAARRETDRLLAEAMVPLRAVPAETARILELTAHVVAGRTS